MGPRSSILLIVVVMLLLAQPLFIVPAGAQGYPPGINFESVSPASYNFVAPTTKDSTVRFYTNVSIWDPDGRTIDVNLKAILSPNETSWSRGVSPASMTFKSTGKRAAIVSVVIPEGITEFTEVQIYLMAQASYPNDTMEADTYAKISISPKYSLEMSYEFTRRDQYENRVTFNITNRGTGQDRAHLGQFNTYYSPEEFDFSYQPYTQLLMPNQTGKIEMSVKYKGSSFPKELVVWVSLYSSYAQTHGQSPSSWNTNVTVTFRAPDKTQQTYLFAGVISAAVIIMVVVMAALVFGAGKKK